MSTSDESGQLQELEESSNKIKKDLEKKEDSPDKNEAKKYDDKLQAEQIQDFKNRNFKQKQEIKDLKANRELKKSYAYKTFCFLIIFNLLILIFIISVGLGCLNISSVPLTSLVGTIPASMVLFGWVLKGLFSE